MPDLQNRRRTAEAPIVRTTLIEDRRPRTCGCSGTSLLRFAALQRRDRRTRVSAPSQRAAREVCQCGSTNVIVRRTRAIPKFGVSILYELTMAIATMPPPADSETKTQYREAAKEERAAVSAAQNPQGQERRPRNWVLVAVDRRDPQGRLAKPDLLRLANRPPGRSYRRGKADHHRQDHPTI